MNDLLELHGLPLAFEVRFGLFVRPAASDPLLNRLRHDRASREAAAHRLSARRHIFGLLALESLSLRLALAFVVNEQTIGVLAVFLAGGNSAASQIVPVITLAVLGVSGFFRLADVLEFAGFHLHEALERITAIARSPRARVSLAPVFVGSDGKHVARAVVIVVADGFAVAVAVELEACVVFRSLSFTTGAHGFLVRAWGQLRYFFIGLHVAPKVPAVARSFLARVSLAPGAVALRKHVASAASL